MYMAVDGWLGGYMNQDLIKVRGGSSRDIFFLKAAVRKQDGSVVGRGGDDSWRQQSRSILDLTGQVHNNSGPLLE